VNEERGWGSAKLLPSGEIAVIVPSLYATHVGSNKAGDKVEFEFSWVSMNVHGEINVAEHAPALEEGWEHVKARVRDHAANMQICGLKVSADMLTASEAILRAEYESEELFENARLRRESSRAHFITPRPQPITKAVVAQAPPPSAMQPFGEPHYEYNPYEAFKGFPGASVLAKNQGKCRETCLSLCLRWLHCILVRWLHCILVALI
jgi:hypothetical protein